MGTLSNVHLYFRADANLQRCKVMADNWDGYGALAPFDDVCARATVLLGTLWGKSIAPDHIGPDHYGGIAFEFIGHRYEVVVQLLGDGGFCAFKSEKDNAVDSIEELKFEERDAGLIDLIAQVLSEGE